MKEVEPFQNQYLEKQENVKRKKPLILTFTERKPRYYWEKRNISCYVNISKVLS